MFGNVDTPPQENNLPGNEGDLESTPSVEEAEGLSANIHKLSELLTQKHEGGPDDLGGETQALLDKVIQEVSSAHSIDADVLEGVLGLPYTNTPLVDGEKSKGDVVDALYANIKAIPIFGQEVLVRSVVRDFADPVREGGRDYDIGGSQKFHSFIEDTDLSAEKIWSCIIEEAPDSQYNRAHNALMAIFNNLEFQDPNQAFDELKKFGNGPREKRILLRHFDEKYEDFDFGKEYQDIASHLSREASAATSESNPSASEVASAARDFILGFRVDSFGQGASVSWYEKAEPDVFMQNMLQNENIGIIFAGLIGQSADQSQAIKSLLEELHQDTRTLLSKKQEEFQRVYFAQK